MNTIRRLQRRIDTHRARRQAEFALLAQINRLALERHEQAQRRAQAAKPGSVQ